VRQGFVDTFAAVYKQETGKDFPAKPDDPRTEFLHLFADSTARSVAMGINSMLI
jgi:hypothetical protein